MKTIPPPHAENYAVFAAVFILDLLEHIYIGIETNEMDMEAAQRAVLAEVTKHDHGLKHVDPPGECFSTTQARLLLEVQGGKHELNRVENRPKDGLTDAEKQAYLNEKQRTSK